jgi:hypothetical protein
VQENEKREYGDVSTDMWANLNLKKGYKKS